MPINANYEYAEALKKVDQAKTHQEKIKALEDLLAAAPKHKGASGLLQEIKTKISKLKEKIQKEHSKKGSRYSILIKKEGAAQVALVGLPNSGKSWILKKFTNAKSMIAEYEFTTKMPEIGVLDFKGIKIQLVELPAFFRGYSKSEKGPSFLAIARSANLICIILDGTKDCKVNLSLIEEEFERASIKLQTLKKKEGIPCLVVINKIMNSFQTHFPSIWVEDLKESIWSKLNLIWVRTKTPGKKPDWPPVALKMGSCVKDLAENIHKDFIRRFRFARIWGRSVKHDSTNVGLDHILEEADIVELHLK